MHHNAKKSNAQSTSQVDEYYDEEESYYSDEGDKSYDKTDNDSQTIKSETTSADEDSHKMQNPRNAIINKLGLKIINNSDVSNKRIYSVTEPKMSARNVDRSPRSPASNYNYNYSSEDDIDFEQFEAFISELADHKRLPPEDYVDAVEEYITQCLPKAIETRNYKEASRYQKAHQNLEILMKSQAEEITYQSKEKLQFAQRKIKDINDKYDMQIRRKYAEFNVLKNNLNEKFAQEDQEFEEKWNSPQQLTPFTKPSRQLLDLRLVEQKYAEAGMFDEADGIKSRADKLEAEETREARRQLMVEMQRAYELLKANQKKQMDGLNSYKEREINNLELKRQRDLRGVERYASRPDIANPPPKIRDAKLFKPRQKRYDIEQKSYTLNLGKFNLKQVIHPETARTPRTTKKIRN